MKTEILRVGLQPFPPKLLRWPALVLRQGGLVVFPTETVYGIGIRADNAKAMSRLCQVKRRDPSKPLAFHIASMDDVKGLVGKVPAMAKRLMDRYWPGPLTLVFEKEKSTIGIRFPSNPVARTLIEKSGVLVSATSANLAGQPPCWSGRQAKDILQGKVDFILDGGETPLKQSSSVVAVSRDRWKILREGIVDKKGIERTVCAQILFVCTGNTCRSPLAEYMTKKMLAEKFKTSVSGLEEFGFHIASAGTKVPAQAGASELAKKIARKMGMNLGQHLSRQISQEELEEAELIFTMDHEQLSQVQSCLESKRKARLLDPRGRDIQDPYGKGERAYVRSAQMIEKAVKEAFRKICGLQSVRTTRE